MSIIVHPLFGDGGKRPLSAKDLSLYEVSVDEAMRLNNEWHSVLPETDKGNLLRTKHNAFYAMEFDGRYYAVGIWTTPVAANLFAQECIELRRLAIAEDAPKYTATRMLSLMRKDIKKKFPEIQKAVSYQAVDHHLGTIYKADNWEAVATTKYKPWNSATRTRKTPQTQSDKVRWEIYL